MDTTAIPTPWSSPSGAAAHPTGLDNGPWQLPIAGVRTKRRVHWEVGQAIETIMPTDRCRVDKWRGTVKPWHRLAVVIWDSQFLRVQHAVYRAAPRLATHIDELARRRDEERRKRQ
jgi:hypothetical protein